MNQNHQPFPRVPVRGEPPTRCPTCGGSGFVNTQTKYASTNQLGYRIPSAAVTKPCPTCRGKQ